MYWMSSDILGSEPPRAITCARLSPSCSDQSIQASQPAASKGKRDLVDDIFEPTHTQLVFIPCIEYESIERFYQLDGVATLRRLKSKNVSTP